MGVVPILYAMPDTVQLSVALAAKVAVALHSPASTFKFNPMVGQVTTGLILSVTTTVKLQL